MIELNNVTWTYPHADAPSLRDLNLRIRPGEFVVLCGASGSGKSTALRVMNGLIPHFHDDGTLLGTATIDGLLTTAAELDEIGLRSGTVLQHPRRQFFAATVREELAFAMENFGFPAEDIRSCVDELTNALASTMPVGERLHNLSGGQQQQVAIAAATAHRPRLLLLDEPSANLSTDAVTRLVDILSTLKEAGVTIVVAEHRLRYLEHLVDRVVVMRDGRIDLEWSAEQFPSVSDADLARERLRGDVQTPILEALPATGTSVRDPAMPSGMTATDGLELHNVRCRFGGRTVLDIERAVFAAGEVTAIRGGNGAGKSTLGRIIAGLERSTGTVRLDGKPLTRRARQRVSAIVMQDVQRQLFSDSVEGEIELTRTSRQEAPNVQRVLQSLDLEHLAERHPLSLSGGQQQRVVVAAARVTDRQIVIFDEPSSGVDRRHLQSICDQIRQIGAEGAVVLLISHDDDLLALAADRQLVLIPPGATRDLLSSAISTTNLEQEA